MVLQIAGERNLFKIIDTIDDLIHKNPKNTVVRAFLEINLFKFDPLLFFNQIPLMTLIKVILI